MDFVDRSLKSMFKLMSTFKTINPSYTTCMHLFDSIIKPVLLYGSDICGYRISKFKSVYNEMKKDVIEKCHLKFCRFVLGVNNRAPNLSIYGDTGRFPIYVSELKSYVKYWFRLKESNNPLLYNAYMFNQVEDSSWWKSITNLLKVCDLTLVKALRMRTSQIVKYIIDKFKLYFKEGWFLELSNDVRNKCYGNKLRSYRNFKKYFQC